MTKKQYTQIVRDIAQMKHNIIIPFEKKLNDDAELDSNELGEYNYFKGFINGLMSIVYTEKPECELDTDVKTELYRITGGLT